MRTPCRLELRAQASNHGPPIGPRDGILAHSVCKQRPLTHRRRPVGSDTTGGVQRDDLKRRPIPVDGHEALTALEADLQCEADNATNGAFFVMRKNSLDERMSESEEVDVFVLDCFLAIERANVRRSAGYAWQAVDERSVSHLK